MEKGSVAEGIQELVFKRGVVEKQIVITFCVQLLFRVDSSMHAYAFF